MVIKKLVQTAPAEFGVGIKTDFVGLVGGLRILIQSGVIPS